MQPRWMKLKWVSIKEKRVLVQYKPELRCAASEYFIHISSSISTVHLFGWQTLRIQKSCQVRKSLTPAGKQVCAQKRKLEIQKKNADQIHLKSSKWCLLVVPGCCLSPKEAPRTSKAMTDHTGQPLSAELHLYFNALCLNQALRDNYVLSNCCYQSPKTKHLNGSDMTLQISWWCWLLS